MKVLIINEMGHGRDSLERISVAAQFIKETFHDSDVTLALRKPLDYKLYSRKHINRIILSPIESLSVSQSNSVNEAVFERYFSTPEKIALTKATWKSLIDEIRPDVVIADNAPLSSLMGAFLGIKTIQIGTGEYLLTKGSTSSKTNSINEQMALALASSHNLTETLERSSSIVVNAPFLFDANDAFGSVSYCHIDNEKDDDGGLNIDIFAYIKKNDPTRDLVLSALEDLNAEVDAKVLVIMPGIEPIMYKPNFELTPIFVRLQGALYNNPLVIHNFNSGMLLEAIKNGSPSWGVPYMKEQTALRANYTKLVSHPVSARSANDIKSSLLVSLENRRNNSDEVRKIWQKALKSGIQPLSQTLIRRMADF
ncbi:hypothetical protein ACI2KR_06955 [Pseudomonas luteola]